MMPAGAPIGGANGGTAAGPGNESPGAGEAGRPASPPPPEQGLGERFQRALRPDDPTPPELPSPMSLFGTTLAAQPAQPAPVTEAAPASLPDRALLQTVERLLVSDGLDGQRAVRLTLGEGALRGTQVEIAQFAGELQVVFHCADADARRRLSNQAVAMAEQLSRRLHREVQLAVQGGGPDGDAARSEHRHGAPSR